MSQPLTNTSRGALRGVEDRGSPRGAEVLGHGCQLQFFAKQFLKSLAKI